MTDNEIIKALKCCKRASVNRCDGCPYRPRIMCALDLRRDAIDLINRLTEQNEGLQEEVAIKTDMLNRQKAEIERAERNFRAAKVDVKFKKAEIDRLKARNDELNTLNKTASIESIKDVLLTLETAVEESDKYIREYEDSKEQRAYNKALKDAYNLVKEMTEQSVNYGSSKMAEQ